MAETWILDDASVATSRYEFDITPYIGENGPDLGDAAIQAVMAEAGQYGSSPVDFTVPNRVVQIPLLLRDREIAGGLSFNEARTYFQAKVALFQREGGWVSRETAMGTVYADVVSATLRFGGSGLQARGLVDADAVLTLECLPDWYGDEVAASPAHDETAVPELIWTETGIEGDYPARCRLVVTDIQSQERRSLLWGFRSRFYDAASTARLAYEAEALTKNASATLVTQSDSSGGATNNAIQYANVGVGWSSVLTTTLSGSDLTHVGTYRVWARARSPQGDDAYLRLLWKLSSTTNARSVENARARLVEHTGYQLVDLGEVRLDRALVGTHSWKGEIQATGTAGTETVQVDRIFLQPLDEAAGQLTGPSPDVLFNASGTVEVRSEGTGRKTSGGVGRGAVPVVLGDLPRLPPSGSENRSVEVLVRASRGDIPAMAAEVWVGMTVDGGIDDIRAQLFYRPCWLYVPDDPGS